MESLWETTENLPKFSQLRQDVDADVLIIGAGMAGVLCAHALEEAGIEYLLVDAGEIGRGVTGKTTAKITAQHGLCYQKLGSKGELYYRANREALERYRELCRGISCDFQEKDSLVFSLEGPEKLAAEIRALEALGVPAELVGDTELPFPVMGAVKLENQAQFHPLKFLSAIAKPLRIFEHTPVRQLVGTTALTPWGRIRARRVVVATHFPFLNKHGSYFMKMYQHRGYVLALEGVGELAGMYVDGDGSGLSLRSQGNILLLGGASHRTGKPGGGWRELGRFARQYYPQATQMAAWATQDCMTLDGIPYIGPYSAATKGLYVATGFNKWGMTGSMAASLVLADQLQGKKNPYSQLFSPSRCMLRPQLAANAGHALAGWVTPGPRCPHLGCALKWNPREHSWDCSCHGSRFDETGKCLNNPATGDLPGK